MIELSKLTTEQRNPRTMHIDEVPTLELVRLINDEDKRVPLAVERILPDVARAVDLVAAALAAGGRLFYLGAGTSGRLGILDAVECPPTYRTDPERIVGLIAGGTPAIFRAKEGAEDDPELGAADLRAQNFSAKDIAVGIAASGRTPYVLGALRYARSVGAKTIALACTSPAAIAEDVDVALLPIVGPEAITGSTRMKAGTAQKLVLNMLSTGAMVKLGTTREAHGTRDAHRHGGRGMFARDGCRSAEARRRPREGRHPARTDRQGHRGLRGAARTKSRPPARGDEREERRRLRA